MLRLQNKARRKAYERGKSQDSESQSDRLSANSVNEATSIFSAARANLPSQDFITDSEPGVCGSDCWARQADLQKPDDISITLSGPESSNQDQVSSLNESIYADLRPWQTRLVVLQPGELGSKIYCKLVNVDVIDGPGLGISGTSDVVYYEALSYSWGSPSLLYHITCDGKLFGITEELAFALQYLRLRNAERYLWCDAISINQHDLLEKAVQIKNMLRIFEKASQVIAWLGRPLPNSAMLFEAIRQVSSSSGRVSTQVHQKDCAAAFGNIAVAASKHLDSPWFRRTWIRQEVYAAKRMILQSGHHESDFKIFTTSLKQIQMVLLSLGAPQGSMQIPPTLETYQNEYQHFGSDGPSFHREGTRPSYVQYCLDCLDVGLRFAVTDERDRIYGSLGLLTSKIVKFFAEVPQELDEKAEAFPIDYGKSLVQVHQDVMKFLINTTRTLEILDAFVDKGHTGPRARVSWHLDFSVKQARYFPPLSWSDPGAYGVRTRLQDYSDVGRLRLAGVRVAKRIQQLNGEKEIGHPQERFSPTYRRSITLRHIMQGTQRRSSGGLLSVIDNPSFAFVFSHIHGSETRQALSMSHHISRLENMDAAFATFLSSFRFAFAYVDDFENQRSFDLASLHFLVPRVASLDDTIVSFYGSKCLHLIRPRHTNVTEWTYIGPIAAVAIGQKSITKYQSTTLYKSHYAQEPEIFELY